MPTKNNDLRKANRKRKSKRRKNKWYKLFDEIFPYPKCWICSRKLSWIRQKNRVHFDHRAIDSYQKIPNDPSDWILRHSCNQKNLMFFINCGFGHLCDHCNRSLSGNFSIRNRLIEYLNLSHEEKIPKDFFVEFNLSFCGDKKFKEIISKLPHDSKEAFEWSVLKIDNRQMKLKF